MCIIAALFMASCEMGIKTTDTLDALVAKNAEELLQDENAFIAAGTENDPLSIALNAAEAFFEGVYTADGYIWQFLADGTVNAYDTKGEKFVHKYTLAYTGAENNNKYIDFTFPEGEKRYRFKKITANGFDAMYSNESGNDSSIFTFRKTPIFEALIYSKPYFTQTFYESNSVWNFKDDGTIKTYDINGVIAELAYVVEYKKEDGKVKPYIIITQDIGNDETTTVTLEIASFASDRFSAYTVIDGERSDNVKTFTM